MKTVGDWIERGRLGSEGGTILENRALVRFLQDEAQSAPSELERDTLRLANLIECGSIDEAIRLCEQILNVCHNVPTSNRWEHWATWIGVAQNNLIQQIKGVALTN